MDREGFDEGRVWVVEELRGWRLLLSLGEAFLHAPREILRFAQDDKGKMQYKGQTRISALYSPIRAVYYLFLCYTNLAKNDVVPIMYVDKS